MRHDNAYRVPARGQDSCDRGQTISIGSAEVLAASAKGVVLSIFRGGNDGQKLLARGQILTT